MKLEQPVKRVFRPKRIEDLKQRCLPWVGREVTVMSWHENISMCLEYPNDHCVGFVQEFAADIPKSELTYE